MAVADRQCSALSRAFALVLALLAFSCADASDAYVLELPPGWQAPREPADNPLTLAKVELGRHLFYDRRLSVNGEQACASCHEQARGFAEARPRSVGATGEVGPRNAPGLANVGYLETLTWVNPLLTSLERQILVPMFGESPVELGMTDREQDILDRFRDDARYQRLFARAFPGADDPFTVQSVVRALSCFARTLISADALYDRYVRGDRGALDDSQLRGLQLFRASSAGCAGCHAPPLFTNGTFVASNVGAAAGLFEVSGREADRGKFRVPSLRNVGLTGPYMHDGSVGTLDEVLARHPKVALSPAERRDLAGFLDALTDERFTSDPRLSDPL